MKPRNWFQTRAASLALISGVVAVAAFYSAAPFARAQDRIVVLRSPQSVRGFIGGESHDSYAIRARKGQKLTVQLSWHHEGHNKADFFVSESDDFSGGVVGFGTKSNGRKSWSGTIPKTKMYYVYVTAHFTAHYVLKVATE